MFKHIILALTVLFAGGLTGSQAGEAKKQYRIALAVYDAANDYMRLWIEAARAHPAVESGIVSVRVFNGENSSWRQYDQFATIATAGYSGAIIVPSETDVTPLLVAGTNLKSLPLVGSCTQVKSLPPLTQIGSDDVRAGYLSAKALLEKTGGGNLYILKGLAGQSATTQRLDGCKQALSEFPDARVLDEGHADWSRMEAMRKMMGVLMRHQETLDGIIAQNDEMALGALDAMRMLDMEPIPVVGIDGIPQAEQAVEQGDMVATIRQDYVAQAQGALDLLLRKIIGPDYAPLAACWTQYPEMPWNNGKNSHYTVPWTTDKSMLTAGVKADK